MMIDFVQLIVPIESSLNAVEIQCFDKTSRSSFMSHAVRPMLFVISTRIYSNESTVKVVFISFGNEIDKRAFHPLQSFIRLNNTRINSNTILWTKMFKHHWLWNIILLLIPFQKWHYSIFVLNYLMQPDAFHWFRSISCHAKKWNLFPSFELSFPMAFFRRWINGYTIKIVRKKLLLEIIMNFWFA